MLREFPELFEIGSGVFGIVGKWGHGHEPDDLDVGKLAYLKKQFFCFRGSQSGFFFIFADIHLQKYLHGPAKILQMPAQRSGQLVAPARAVMIGDTTFDMDMAASAGIGSIGVSWGYHPVDALRADAIVHAWSEIPAAIEQVLENRL